MAENERVRLLGGGVNEVIEVRIGTDVVEHEGRRFQRTGAGHRVGPGERVTSFHLIVDEK